jgi:hypothetical protein
MRRLLIALLAISLMFLLNGCFDNSKNENNSGEDVPSVTENETESQDEYITYNDGRGIVSYKDKLYYVEYNNNDFVKTALGGHFYKDSDYHNSQRYVNIINSNGRIDNLFRATDIDSIHVIDDRFYLQRNTGMLYSVDMKGENGLDFARGIYVGFDFKNHTVYYTNANATDKLSEIDTKTLSIKNVYDFDNPYIGNDFVSLGVNGGSLYYYTFNDTTDEFELCKHEINENTNSLVAKAKVERTDAEKSLIKYEGELDRYDIIDK